MKNLLLILIALCMVTPVFATEEIIDQQIQNDSSYLGTNFIKVPSNKDDKQLIVNHKSFLVLNIILNGKTKNTNK